MSQFSKETLQGMIDEEYS